MSTLDRIPEPTAADLAEIEAEWPQIQADIDALADPDYVDLLVDLIFEVEREQLAAADLGRRRQRRRTARLTREMTQPTARKAVA